MLPFLKNQKESGAEGDDEVKKRDPDKDNWDMLDAVADDMLEAFKKGDKARLKSALEALVVHIQDQDIEQDQSMEMT